MNSSTRQRRPYNSERRAGGAAETRERILEAAKALFACRGVDAVTLAEIARAAGVSVSSLYGQFRSKEGLLKALFESAMFGAGYQAAVARLDDQADPVEQVLATASVARAIYENERAELGLLRGVSALSPALQNLERGFDDLRYRLQEPRIVRLIEAGKARPGLAIDEARRLLWTYTSRDVFRMLVQEGGFTAEAYEVWLRRIIAATLIA